MKKIFTTTVPDQVGAFLKASRIFSKLGLNITRVSYNKAVDAHLLFVEAEGSADMLDKATEELYSIGYLQDTENSGNVIIVEFRMPDVPGTVQPVLELISRYNINISYLSSQENNTGYQNFRMGLFVQNTDDISDLLKNASQLCDVEIINYDPTDVALDNTVFYVSFANKIAQQNNLSDEEKRNLILDSNLIMDMLTRKDSSPFKTFDFIGKFAENLMSFKGSRFVPRVTEQRLSNGSKLVLFEPSCGSNTCVIETADGLIVVDGGFPCYHDEILMHLRKYFPGFDTTNKILLLTHGDVDHVGIADVFDEVYESRNCYDNFVMENRGAPNIREQNAAHAPYVRISKILSHYRPLNIESLRVIGGKSGEIDGILEKIGNVEFSDFKFEVYEAKGGHVAGEVVYIERNMRILFTGDIIVNTKGFTKEQAEFNRLAPFLMTSVDTDPVLAAKERKEIKKLLDAGTWQIFGGHGSPMVLTV